MDKKKSHEISLNEPIGTDKEGNEISIIDVIESGEKSFLDEYILKYDIEQLNLGIDSCLNDREKLIICKRYGIRGYREV